MNKNKMNELGSSLFRVTCGALITFFIININFSLAQDNNKNNKEQILDFSAGIIEGELNRPSILMELGTNFKDFSDLILLREDFNSFHEVDSLVRLRFMEEKK